MPVALDQAGAYVEETGCSLQTYLDRFHAQQHALLARRGRAPAHHPDSVDATLSLAYRHVSTMNPAAAELLCLCAFLYPDLISEEMLASGATALGPTLAPIGLDALRLDEALADLASLSLIRRDRRSHALSVHRLVQDVVRSGLSAEQHQLWATRAVAIVEHSLPDGDAYHFTSFPRLLPQAMAAITLINAWEMRTAEAARLTEQVGAYHHVTGDYSGSRRLLLQSLQLRKRLANCEQSDIAPTYTYLAELALSLGQYARAEVLATAALVHRRAEVPPLDLRIADSMNLLGRVHTERGRYAPAETLVRDALELHVRALGEWHPRVAETLSQLAEIAFMRGRYRDTEVLLARAGPILSGRGAGAPSLQMREAALGPDHPKLAYSLQSLSEILLAQGRVLEAEPIARRGLAIRDR
ncbi:MAG: tetratricopeptide repeat protein, partial [Chloroflexi bacterium]|nr:tetratricopeptide repeat protein [Chloroflexota bacterium]